MSGFLKPPGAFTITPHKVSVCVLLQLYAPAALVSVPFPFDTAVQHNRLGLFLFAQTKSCDNVLEPKLDELIDQLKEVGDPLNHLSIDHLNRRLTSLSSPDDLFNFFNDLQGIVGPPASSVMDDDHIMLDPSSFLGMFARRCLLAFNLISFEGVCHLLTNLDIYCKQSLKRSPYKLSNVDDSGNDQEAPLQYENMDLENFVFEKVTEEFHAKDLANVVPFHNHAPKALIGLVADMDTSPVLSLKHTDNLRESKTCSSASTDKLRVIKPQGGAFLRSNWQIQGYLAGQADAIEKHGSSFPLYELESILEQLQKLAPELHRVHFLRYLNNLYHDDYLAALENLHRYFDYSAGAEGFDCIAPSSGCTSFGRYEIALLCLGVMQFQFGHPNQALEVLTEAVRVSQQHGDDSCLAYTLAAICNLLSETGISNRTGVIGSSYSPLASVGSSLSIQQQLYVLLRRSLKRAESLKMKRLVASAHLAIARFDMTHVQRPLLSFGPKASMKLRTYPANVFKELRLSSSLITEFEDETSVMTIDGAFCTTWLKNMKKPIGSLIFSPDNAPKDSDASNLCAQPTTVPGSVMQLIGSSYLVRATAWEIYGSASLARMNALTFATCLHDSSSSADAALAYAKLIQHLAVYKGYAEAFSALKIAEEKFLCVSKSRILLVKLQLLHERALHQGQLKLAQQLCDELGVLASPSTGVDMDLKTEASLRHARTLLAANQFSQAAAVAHSLFSLCYKFNLQVENATVLLLLAEIHKRSGNAVLGIPYALASLSFCQSFNLDLLRASATLTLAELWLSHGPHHGKRALALLHSAFPTLVGHGGLELRARAFIAEAKCYLAEPSFSVREDPEVVLEALRQATEALEQIEYHELAAEAYYLMARVHDKMVGGLEEREKAAASFKKHLVALENPADEQDTPLFNML